MMKLLILGDGEHGKGTLCKYLYKEFGYTSMSSSMFAARAFLYGKLAPKYGYNSFDDCYEDRRNKRIEWYEAIKDYNKSDPKRLARNLTQAYDIYDGMRDIDEFNACQSGKDKLFDLVVYVDASKRLPTEEGSMSIPRERADIVIENNGTEAEFLQKVHRLFSHLLLD